MPAKFNTITVVPIFLIIISVWTFPSSSQPTNFQVVSSDGFNLILDSLKNSPNSEYALESIWCDELNNIERKRVINSLSRGIYPHIPEEKKKAVYAEYAFGPGKASVDSELLVVNISNTQDPDWGASTTIRFLGGDVELNPWQKLQKRETFIDVDNEALLKDDDCDFYWLMDTLLPNGAFVHFEKQPDSLRIMWGNNEFKRTFPVVFDCKDYGTSAPDFDWANDKLVGLRYGCGTQCWGMYVLPLNQSDSIQHFWYSEAINLETSTLAHIHESQRDILILTKLDTQQQFEIELDSVCNSEGIGACIERVELTNSELTVFYQDWVEAASFSVSLKY